MVARTILTGSVALCLLAGCSRSEAPTPGRRGVKTTTTAVPADLRNAQINKMVVREPTFLDSSAVGDQLGADGTVAKANDSIPEGHKIFFTMKLKESPSGLQTRAVWKDTFAREMTTEEKPMNGGKVITFTSKPLPVGRYSVVGYWGGNVAVEVPFEVVAAKKKK